MLASAQVNQFPLPQIDSILADHWHNQTNPDTLVIGGLWVRYDRFKAAAITQNLISWDGTYFRNVPGAASPFEQGVVFALSGTDDVRYGLTQIIHFHPDWLFTNQPEFWNTLEMDAGDGLGWRAISPDDVLTIHYAKEGLYYLDFRIVSTSGDTLNCTANIDIRTQINLNDFEIRSFGDEPDEIIQLGNMASRKVWAKTTDKCGKAQWKKTNRVLPEGLTASIFYNKNCDIPALRKPLILVNGFDPGMEYNWEYVMGADGILKKSYNDPEEKLLSDHFYDQMYDIIYVNFSNSTNDIRVNAMWLRQLIEQVNGMKVATGSKEKNIILGASMGGLVSKWALLTLENDGVDHETELLITIDSPLRGANIPLGMQAMVKDLSETRFLQMPLRQFEPALAFATETLSSKAARQMLYYNWTTTSCTQCNGNDLSEEHNEFFNELSTLGSLNVPHMAITNGSLTGTGNSIIPSELLLHEIDYTSVLWSQLFKCASFQLPIGNAHFALRFQVWAAPGHSGWFPLLLSNKSGVVYYKETMAYVLGIPFPSWAVYKADNIVAWDHAPGGLRTFNSKNEFGDEENQYNRRKKSFCFIPTVSALDIETNDPFYTNLNLINVQQTVKSGEVSLRAYVGPVSSSFQNWEYQINQDHIVLDRRSANFLKSMLKTNGLQASDSPLNAHTYNFGYHEFYMVDPEIDRPLRTSKFIDFDLHIEQNGKLWIHRDDRIDFTHIKDNPFNNNGEIFDVHVVPAFCDQSDVTVSVAAGGEIRIGSVEDPFTGQLYFHPNTNLHVQQGGRTILDAGYHNNLILQGGQMTIFSGGFVDARWGSRILVKEGSTLTVKTGATLRISHYSALEVEAGGRLILEPGAIIQLWDGQQPNGNATIHIRNGGELVWQGDIDFTGNGFFQFDKDHIFTLLNDFQLSGMGKDYRFLRLNGGAELRVQGLDIDLSFGAVEYGGWAAIDHSQGQTRIRDVRFYGQHVSGNDIGLMLTEPVEVQIANTDFSDLENGMSVEGFQGTAAQFLVDQSRFENCRTGLLAGDCSYLTFKNTDFIGCEPAINLDKIQAGVKYFYGYDLNIRSADPSMQGNVGVLLYDAPVFRLHNSTIENYHTGIEAPLKQYGDNRANVFLYGCTISNCQRAVEVLDGGTGPDRGLVLMDCTRALQNTVTVKGQDILLCIDASLHAQNHPQIGVTPNTFLKQQPQNNFFEICQDKRKDMNEIPARQNSWNGNGPGGAPSAFELFIKKSGQNGNCHLASANIPLITVPLAQAIANCPEPPRMPEGPGSNAGGQFQLHTPSHNTCILVTTGLVPDTFKVHEDYLRGMNGFYWEDFELAMDHFLPVASIPNETRANLSDRCRQYVDESRVFVEALTDLVGGLPIPLMQHDYQELQTLSSQSEVALEISELVIFPNPAGVQTVIRSAWSEGRIEVRNILGQVVLEQTYGTDIITLDTSLLSNGWYQVSTMDDRGMRREAGRLMISH